MSDSLREPRRSIEEISLTFRIFCTMSTRSFTSIRMFSFWVTFEVYGVFFEHSTQVNWRRWRPNTRIQRWDGTIDLHAIRTMEPWVSSSLFKIVLPCSALVSPSGLRCSMNVKSSRSHAEKRISRWARRIWKQKWFPDRSRREATHRTCISHRSQFGRHAHESDSYAAGQYDFWDYEHFRRVSFEHHLGWPVSTKHLFQCASR